MGQLEFIAENRRQQKDTKVATSVTEMTKNGLCTTQGGSDKGPAIIPRGVGASCTVLGADWRRISRWRPPILSSRVVIHLKFHHRIVRCRGGTCRHDSHDLVEKIGLVPHLTSVLDKRETSSRVMMWFPTTHQPGLEVSL